MAFVVDRLNHLCLEHLDHGWVEALYDTEFLEIGDLPPEYETAIESVELQSTLREIMKTIDDWLSSTTESGEEKSWTTLSPLFQPRKVLALLAYYIDYGCKNVLTKEYRTNALLSSRLYYKLLSIPGFKAYDIYHSQLFTHSLECLGFPKAMCEQESHFNKKELTREVNSVIKELGDFTVDLRVIVEGLRLNPNDMNFEDIVSNLVDITSGAIVNKLQIDKIELTKMSGVIYDIINILICDANKEPNAVAIKLLFKCLLPKLIASSLDNRNANNLVRASYVTYSGLILSTYGKAALSGFMVLLEHLCYSMDGLERAEVRAARVQLVIGMMSFLPRKAYKKIVKWILQLSTTTKVLHRQIALELLASLLSNDPEEVGPTESVLAQSNETGNNSTDVATNAENNEVQPNENQIPTDNANELPKKYVVATDDESSQDSQIPIVEPDHEMTDEEIAGLLRQRPHTVPHAEILRAVYERVLDTSGTLRTRSINILTECVASDRLPMKNAIKELNGEGEVSRLMAVGARSVCDERAAVRKAGVGLVQHLLVARDALPPQPTDLSILVSLCRDASIVVRSAAIAALGELLILRPSDAVFDAFLSGPMHQLCDPEVKVEEQVVSLIKSLLFGRLNKFMGQGNDDPYPWRFLAAITRHNMRRRLQKACLSLSKNANCINIRLVDILSTHLGVLDDERDLQCLVLLTSVARHVEYSDIGFVLEYYYKLGDTEQMRDARLMPLTLELLTLWSRFLQSRERCLLRDHLVRRLADARNDGCRILCSTLAAQLDPDNLTWSTELMQLSERRAVRGGDVEEAVRAADLSLVAPAPPSGALLRLFLGALGEPPPDWGARLGACVAGAGRLCVRSREAAVAAAPALAALLPRADVPLPARVNALLALTDICRRYTCIMEPLLGSVCDCMSAHSPPLLRRTAVRALTRLMLGGYLRLRETIYYRFFALLADEDHDVREPAEYYVTCCLTSDCIYHHFVDCVLYFNNDETENIKFDSRQLIYDVMLQRMSAVQKLNVQCRLAQEIMAHAANIIDEGEEELPPALNAALLDTITLLCGPRMKQPKKPENKTTDGNDIEELQERVTNNIVSHKMKTTVAEVMVPAVLRLYAHYRVRGGQLAAYLVRIATDLLNDYRLEIEELFDSDGELVQRVRQFQETFGLDRTAGNVRNLVTSTAPPEPDTPRAPRRRPRAPPAPASRKRTLRI